MVEKRTGSVINGFILSTHALKRMSSRGFTHDRIRLVIDFGRQIHTRGAEIFALGKKEVLRACKSGFDLSKWEGSQIVCSTQEPIILTMYNNKNFHKSFK